MKALTMLYRSGLTREGVATAINQTTHSVRLYERGKRFPSRSPYSGIVQLAESRGLTLLARDFIEEGDEA